MALSLLLCITVSFLGFAIWFRRKKSKLEEFMSSLPGPQSLPFFGHTFMFIAPSVTKMFDRLMRLAVEWPNIRPMDKVARFKFPTDDFALIFDPYTVQAILRSPQFQDKDKTIYALFESPKSLITSNGKLWMAKRKAVIPGFHPIIMTSLDTFYRQRVDQFFDNIRPYADSKEIFDLKEEMAMLSADLLGDSFFGVSMDVQKKKDTTLASISFALPQSMIIRFLVPIFRPKFICWIFRGWLSHEKFFKGGRALAKEAVTKRMEYRARLEQGGNSKDASLESGQKIYLDILLDMFETADDGNLDDVVEDMIEIWEAGISTTTSIACWVCLLSGVFPEVGEKLHAEIEEHFSSDEQSMDIENCAKLKYLDMVIKEALRHFTVPISFRQNEEDVFIKDVGTIPAKARIGLFLTALHHHPAYWEKPLEFYPEHFLPENVAKRPNCAFLPFSGGKRVCPGEKYAMQTLKCTLTQILSKVKFRAAKMKPWKNVYSENSHTLGFTLIPPDGFFVTVEFKDKILNDRL